MIKYTIKPDSLEQFNTIKHELYDYIDDPENKEKKIYIKFNSPEYNTRLVPKKKHIDDIKKIEQENNIKNIIAQDMLKRLDELGYKIHVNKSGLTPVPGEYYYYDKYVDLSSCYFVVYVELKNQHVLDIIKKYEYEYI